MEKGSGMLVVAPRAVFRYERDHAFFQTVFSSSGKKNCAVLSSVSSSSVNSPSSSDTDVNMATYPLKATCFVSPEGKPCEGAQEGAPMCKGTVGRGPFVFSLACNV